MKSSNRGFLDELEENESMEAASGAVNWLKEVSEQRLMDNDESNISQSNNNTDVANDEDDEAEEEEEENEDRDNQQKNSSQSNQSKINKEQNSSPLSYEYDDD